MYFQNHEMDVFDEIRDRLSPARSEFDGSEGSFLNGVIRYFKPRKILEIGVAAGGSSAIILNAIKDMEEAKLYSVDLSTQYYRTQDKPTGYAVGDFFPELVSLNKWELKTGKLVYEFIDEIGDGIDLCFIDTVHARPGEILDYLMVLPYLSPKCVIVIHDITYHTHPGKCQGGPCGLLFSAIRGTKYTLMEEDDAVLLPNIGAIVCDETNRADSFSVFNLLSLRWNYTVAPEKIKDIREFFSRHYSDRELYWFDLSYLNQLEQDKLKAEQQAKSATQQGVNPAQIKELEKQLNLIQPRVQGLEKQINVIQAWIQEQEKQINVIQAWIQEQEKPQTKQYSFSQKVKAYALFPWYLYRGIKERRL